MLRRLAWFVGLWCAGVLTLAAVAWALPSAILRVHDVAETVQFLDVWYAIAGQGRSSA